MVEPRPYKMLGWFHNAATGSTVDVIGTIHYGKPGYYSEINGYIAPREAAGAFVHYELTASSKRNVALAGFATWKRARRITKHGDAVESFMMKAVDGVVGQYDRHGGLACGDGWENHDMSLVEIAQQLGMASLCQMAIAGTIINFANKLPPDKYQYVAMGVCQRFRQLPRATHQPARTKWGTNYETLIRDRRKQSRLQD